MGISLHEQEIGVTEHTGRIAFSIQHPDLSSTLVTQKDAFTAEFESVTCRVNFTPMQDEPSKKKRSLKRKRGSKSDEDIGTRQLDGVTSDDDYVACLSSDDQRAIDEFIQSLHMVPPQKRRDIVTPKTAQSAQAIEFSDRFKYHFETAMELLVLGSTKKRKEIVTIDCNRAECLTKLAPAVFHMPYLKVGV